MDLKIYLIMLNNMINITNNLTRIMPKNIPVYSIISTGITNFFILVTTIGAGVVIATTIIGFFFYNGNYNDDLDSDNDVEVSSSDDGGEGVFPSDYENTNLEEYKNLEDKDISEDYEMNINSFIEEKTPRGIIMMNYDSNNNLFVYYTNSNDIPYKYLEMMGRQFVIVNNCKNIFVNYNFEITKAKELYNKQVLEEERITLTRMKDKKEELNKKKIFAQFKDYNKKIQNNNKKMVDNLDNIVPEKSNRYVRKGNINDFNDYKKNLNNEKSISDEFEHIDYSTFKKMFSDNEKKTL